jgi:hypothetical protein
MTELPPIVVGMPTRIRLIERRSSGGSASVWRARDVRDGVDVAVKLIAPVTGLDDTLRLDRLEREGRALARLRGVEGIVGVRELGLASDGTAWLVCDLAAGGSLHDAVQDSADGRGDLRWIGRQAARTARALAAAHEQAIVHGDLSPSNVLVLGDGDAALADFGMAQLLDDLAGRGVAGCTPAYAAPERLAGAAPDPASDVHAFCATWRWALERVTARSSAAPADGLAELDEVLRTGLAARPLDRPTAAQLARRLAPWDGASGSGRAGPGRRRRRR